MINKAKLDKSTPVPLYYQLKTLILNEIKSGEYKSGDMIPTENELSGIFDISRTTIRQAITELVREGYLYRVKSKGTFVSKPKLALHVSTSVYTFNGDVKQSGYESVTQLLKMETIPMPQMLIDLGAGGDKAVYLYRKRFLDGQPLNRVITYLPYDKFPDLQAADLEKNTLREIMNRSEETAVARWTRTVEAVQADRDDIDLLEVPAAFPILKMTTVRYNARDELLDVSLAFLRSDMSKVEMSVNV